MKCDICKTNEAVLFIEDVEGHKVIHRNICMTCMMKMSTILPILMSSARMRKGLKLSDMNIAIDKQFLKCPHCNRSLEEIENTHTVGCGKCYEVFAGFINNIIFEGDYTLPYKGSYPKNLQRFSDHRNRINQLKSQLRDAVNTEDFENAAKVRDELKKEKEKFKK